MSAFRAPPRDEPPPPVRCANCRAPLGTPAYTSPEHGALVCDEPCAQGYANGELQRRMIELGIYWGKFFKALGL